MNQIRAIGPAALGAGGDGVARKSPSGVADDEGFGALLAAGLRDTTRSLRVAEEVSVAGLTGAAPVQQVVGAVMEAEQRLQLAVSVRDKIVAAYLEISRMQI